MQLLFNGNSIFINTHCEDQNVPCADQLRLRMLKPELSLDPFPFSAAEGLSKTKDMVRSCCLAGCALFMARVPLDRIRIVPRLRERRNRIR